MNFEETIKPITINGTKKKINCPVKYFKDKTT